MSSNHTVKKARASVSATDLAKLGYCELMILLGPGVDDSDQANQRIAAGNQEHERFHFRAVLNAGSKEEYERLCKTLASRTPAKRNRPTR